MMIRSGSWKLFGLLSILLLPFHLVFAQPSPPKSPLKLFGQTLPPDAFIKAHYYDEIPYSFLSVTRDDQQMYRAKDALLLRLFFNTEVRLKKLVLTPTDTTNITDPIKQIYLFDQGHICHMGKHTHQNVLYLDKEVKVLDIHVLPDPLVKELKVQVKAYGLSRQSIFFIIKHLLKTRNDPDRNEALLRRLYTKGYSSILSLLKYEQYTHLYLTSHSLFYLPDDADYSVPVDKTVALLREGAYISHDGKRQLPKQVKQKEYLLFVDKQKIRFLKNVDPQNSIVIKKIDLAE